MFGRNTELVHCFLYSQATLETYTSIWVRRQGDWFLSIANIGLNTVRNREIGFEENPEKVR